MNKARRKDITAVVERMKAAIDPLNDCATDVESIKDEEEEVYENMPEGLQGSEQGERIQEAVDALNEAHSALETLMDSIEEIVGHLEAAAE